MSGRSRAQHKHQGEGFRELRVFEKFVHLNIPEMASKDLMVWQAIQMTKKYILHRLISLLCW